MPTTAMALQGRCPRLSAAGDRSPQTCRRGERPSPTRTPAFPGLLRLVSGLFISHSSHRQSFRFRCQHFKQRLDSQDMESGAILLGISFAVIVFRKEDGLITRRLARHQSTKGRGPRQSLPSPHSPAGLGGTERRAIPGPGTENGPSLRLRRAPVTCDL